MLPRTELPKIPRKRRPAHERQSRQGTKAAAALDPKLITNDFRNGKVRQEAAPRPPLRAIRIKGDALRASIHRNSGLDWSDIHERYIDLWQEARMVIWRAKHSKSGIKQADPLTGKEVLTFVADDRLVIEAINCTKGVLDSLVKLRKEMGPESTGMPRWAIAPIERALHNHPEALNELLKELAAEEVD